MRVDKVVNVPKEGRMERMEPNREIKGLRYAVEKKGGPKYTNYSPLISSPSQVLMAIKNTPMLRWPTTWSERPKNHPNAGNGQLCKFHNKYGHGTDEYHQLRDELERLVRENRLTKYVANTRNLEWKQGEERHPEGQRDERQAPALPPPPPRPPRGGNPNIQTIHMIMGGPTEGDSGRARRKSVEAMTEWRGEVHYIF